ASSIGARGGAGPAGHLLVWTSADGHPRGAAVVRAAAAVAPGALSGVSDPPSEASPPRPAPAWAAELDGQILGEMAEECAWRYQQRGFQLARHEREAVEDWAPLEVAEGAIDTLVIGLVECGGRAAEVVVGAAAPDAPGTIYTAARTLLEGGELARAVALAAEHAPVDAAVEEAVLRAFQHA